MPSKHADREILSSQSITKYLVDNILNQDEEYGYDTWKEQMQNRSKVRTENRKRSEEEADDIYKELPEHLQKAVDLAKQKGASSWLTVLPLAEHDFVLHRAAFLDALSLRYGWTPSNMPPTSVEHALSCARGGFPSIRHNEIRDITASLLTEVCHDVSVEPHLQPSTEWSHDQLSRRC